MGAAIAGREVAALAAPASSKAERLAEHAALLARWLERPERSPKRWRSDQFGRLIELVRAHLRPISSSDLLAQSYSREHFHVVVLDLTPDRSALLRQDATEVAYALRWLELGDGLPRAPWHELVSAVQG